MKEIYKIYKNWHSYNWYMYKISRQGNKFYRVFNNKELNSIRMRLFIMEPILIIFGLLVAVLVVIVFLDDSINRLGTIAIGGICISGCIMRNLQIKDVYARYKLLKRVKLETSILELDFDNYTIMEGEKVYSFGNIKSLEIVRTSCNHLLDNSQSVELQKDSYGKIMLYFITNDNNMIMFMIIDEEFYNQQNYLMLIELLKQTMNVKCIDSCVN